MAHLFSLAQAVKPSYVDGKKSESDVQFPDTVFFEGFNKPSRFEGDILELEVSGSIPLDLDGTFYRIQPDHQFPPLFEEDIHFNGDGSVSAFSFKNGHVDFKQRYVQTERFKHERKARKSLFGRYRNPYTDNEMVKGIIRTAANTNVVFWRGVLLAMKEDGPPFAMDPVTLETIGRYDFDGQVRAPTFTAHPKFDPKTGEIVCFGYEAGGNGNDGSCDIVVYTIAKDGKKTEECWYKAPFCGMIHDMGLSENFVVLPMTPIKCSPDRLKKGGNHFAWDPNEDQLYGIVPRRGGKPKDIVWLRAPNGFQGHVAGCYEDSSGHILCDLSVASDNIFYWFPPDGSHPMSSADLAKRNKSMTTDTYRFSFDPKTMRTNDRITATSTFGLNGEFSRIDDRFVAQKYDHFWQCQIDPKREYDFGKCGSPAGGLFNVLGHFRWSEPDDKEDVWWAGPTTTFQEPTFIPRRGGTDEGDGWLIVLLNHLDVLRNDILIFDAKELRKGPIARISLPLKLRLGLHGNWVDAAEIEEWDGVRKAVKGAGKMDWQVGENGATGAH